MFRHPIPNPFLILSATVTDAIRCAKNLDAVIQIDGFTVKEVTSGPFQNHLSGANNFFETSNPVLDAEQKEVHQVQKAILEIISIFLIRPTRLEFLPQFATQVFRNLPK